jgi:putative DNA primase/helicase
MRIDTDRLLADTDIVTVIERHVPLKRKGTEWHGVCPFHDDHKASLQVNKTKQIYACFACGAAGDSIDFLTRLGLSFKDACNEIAGGDAAAPQPIEKRKAKESTKAIQWRQVMPDSPATDIRHYRHGVPSRTWQYQDDAGQLIGYICRFDLPDGTKEILPYIYATDGNRREWRWQGFDAPRPLFNLHLLSAKPDVPVLVVEGEKTADAAAALFPAYVVTCWQGGARAIHKTNWLPLAGRNVILWPDHDEPGVRAMVDIAELLGTTPKGLRYVANPSDAPKHWDVADATWTPEQAKAYLKANLLKEPPAPPAPIPDSIPDEPPPLPPMEDMPQVHVPDEDHRPFRVLGYSKDGDSTKYHFFGHASKTVITLSASSLAKNNLLQLAPLNYWEGAGFGSGKGKLQNEIIANMLMAECTRRGHFSDKNIRGRGAWIETDGTVVIHTGDKLVVNGQPRDLSDHSTRYIYESSEPLGFNTLDPLPAEQACRLVDVLRLLNWDRDVNAYLLAGWCVIAPVCGVLNWRPHVWLTGAAGTGKSWVFTNIVRRLLGDTCLAVQGETTEPGLRQILGHDALPVVFDEAEGEDRRSQERMQSVLALMRAASADDGGIMAKGTAGGSARTYRIRSCFAFASIAYQVAQQSDRTRVTVLGLRRAMDAGKDERWQKLQRDYHELVTNEFVRRLQARTLNLIPIILENARTFATAAAMHIGEQRAGDQLGALIAGAYSLFKSKRVTLEEALEWVKARNWDEERGLDRTRDEFALLGFLLEQSVQIETSVSRYERTIGELVAIASQRVTDIDIMPEGANNKLKRCGLKVDRDYLLISNQADWIMRKLDGKPWSKNHGKILARIEGTEMRSAQRFGPGLQQRAVAIPLSFILE